MVVVLFSMVIVIYLVAVFYMVVVIFITVIIYIIVIMFLHDFNVVLSAILCTTSLQRMVLLVQTGLNWLTTLVSRSTI